MKATLRRWLSRPPPGMALHVHQVVFQDPQAPPPTGYVAEAMTSVRAAFPHAQYRAWTLPAAEAFIAKHYPPEVLWAFRCLKPYAYKADLFKYCVLQRLGGWYVDAGVRLMLSPARIFEETEEAPRFVLFRATGPGDAPWNCSVALLYAREGEAAFATAIDEVVEHCRERHYGFNPLCPTMSAFGRALALHDVRAPIRLGTVVDVEGERYHRAYDLPPLGLIASRKPRRARVGSVAEIGLAGSNNYWKLWHERAVYAPCAAEAGAADPGQEPEHRDAE